MSILLTLAMLATMMAPVFANPAEGFTPTPPTGPAVTLANKVLGVIAYYGKRRFRCYGITGPAYSNGANNRKSPKYRSYSTSNRRFLTVTTSQRGKVSSKSAFTEGITG